MLLFFKRRNVMRILMLGNSYTSANHLPLMLAEMTGAEVIAHTRGGARLAEQINPATKLGNKTLKALHAPLFQKEKCHAYLNAGKQLYISQSFAFNARRNDRSRSGCSY